MIAVPAIDLKGGRCVQLVGGRPEEERVSLPDPLAIARQWHAMGFSMLHLVDLDAALATGDNLPLLRTLVTATPAITQVGGGILTTDVAQEGRLQGVGGTLGRVLMFALVATACTPATQPPDETVADPYYGFVDPRPVAILGYEGHAMEPFLSRDGRLLFFNNRNQPEDQTDLHVAAFRDSLTFEYLGPVGGANSPALDGVPTMDRAGTFYFVTTRSYDEDLTTIYRGVYANGAVTGVEAVPGISLEQPGAVNFDVEVSADGNSLFFVDGRFSQDGRLLAADLALAQRDGERFTRPTGAAALFADVNTDALEYAAAISPDGLELLFTGVAEITAAAPPQIYRSTRDAAGAPFGPRQLVAAATGFVEAATFSPDGHAIYYHKLEGQRFVLYRLTR